jgi:hypothetical protein
VNDKNVVGVVLVKAIKTVFVLVGRRKDVIGSKNYRDRASEGLPFQSFQTFKRFAPFKPFNLPTLTVTAPVQKFKVQWFIDSQRVTLDLRAPGGHHLFFDGVDR